MSRAYIWYCFKVGIPNLDCGYMFGPRVSRTGWGHFELDLWHISYIIRGRNPKFSVWIRLRVVECHTLFIDHCVSFMKIYCLGGYFINLWHNSWFCLIINFQTVQLKGIFTGGTTLFSHRRKDWMYQINIYIFSLNAAPIQHDTGKNKLYNFPKLQASTLWLYQCLSFKVLLPTCILCMWV